MAVATVKQQTFLTLFHAFGPMPDAYTGPYPTEAEARALIANSGTESDVTSWEMGELTMGGRRLRVDWRWRITSAPIKRVSGALLENCAIVLIETEDAASLSLVDLGGFGWFATYRIE